MDLSKKINSLRDKILAIAKKHGAYNVRVFGSVSRGKEKAGSDLDLLI
jgi:hypothetical protein